MSTNGNTPTAVLASFVSSTPDTTSHVAESSAVVRERSYDRDTDIAYLLGLFRNQRTTGTLRIDISQGTVNGVRLEERKKLP